jgi:hypothetical protein
MEKAIYSAEYYDLEKVSVTEIVRGNVFRIDPKKAGPMQVYHPAELATGLWRLGQAGYHIDSAVALVANSFGDIPHTPTLIAIVSRRQEAK